jgi:hypothetical protein
MRRRKRGFTVINMRNAFILVTPVPQKGLLHNVLQPYVHDPHPGHEISPV